LEERLNWLIFGAGAIGTYIGGSLILSGQRVVFVENPPAPSEILERGLRLNLSGQEHRILHPDICTNLPEALSPGHFDIAIFAIKSYDTSSTLDSIQPLAEKLPPILCLQNGVENEPALEKVFGKGNVIAGTVTSSVGRRAAGDIVLERLRGVGISSNHSLSKRIAQVFTDAKLNAHLYSSARSMKWSKMLTNLLANASAAILDMKPGEILRLSPLYKIEVAQLREAIAVMHALNLKIVDLPDTPVRAFSWMVEKLPPNLSQPLISQIAGKGRGQKMPSFHIDLYSKHGKSEVDYLNGAVVRFGERLGIPTPINKFLNQTLLDLTSGRIALEMYAHNPDRFISDCSTLSVTKI
jgi:2-dehydropantoate 2-reductase